MNEDDIRKADDGGVVGPVPGEVPELIVLPNMLDMKMEAIVQLAIACKELAKAINGSNVNMKITHCIFQNGLDVRLKDPREGDTDPKDITKVL